MRIGAIFPQTELGDDPGAVLSCTQAVTYLRYASRDLRRRRRRRPACLRGLGPALCKLGSETVAGSAHASLTLRSASSLTALAQFRIVLTHGHSRTKSIRAKLIACP
jgi:hypothetical protein